jgi:hypothetical protein
MAPFIVDGDPVRLEPPARPRRGHVLLCRGEHGELRLHRVVQVSAAGVVTRGDASVSDDPAVPPSGVLGRAVAVAGRRPLHLRFPFDWILALRPASLPALRPLRAAARRVLLIATRA